MSSNTPREASRATGYALGIGAHLMWGFFPLYFVQLSPAGALEVIVYRAVFGLGFCLLILALWRRLGQLRTLWQDRAALWRLSVAGFLVVINWSVYVYAIQTDRTVDAAVGYFINPIFTVALALVVLRETITRLQALALALGVVAVIVMVAGLGYVPWISFALPASFGLYALVKKTVASRVPPVAGMTIETAAVSPLLLAYLGYLFYTGSASFQTISASPTSYYPWPLHLALLAGAGLLTIIPLVMFAGAAKHLPLGILGMVQYVGPILQMIIGVAVFHEHMPTVRWIAAGIIWISLLILSIDAMIELRRSRNVRRRAVTPPETR